VGGDPVKHLTEEELTEIYYGDGAPAGEKHLEACSECQMKLARLDELLRSFQHYRAPEPDGYFEERIWNKVSERLPAPKKSSAWWRFRPLVFAPALAGLLVLAVAIGLVVARRDGRTARPSGITEQARTRVLFNTLSDHLDRSQILLAEVANARPGPDSLRSAQARARDLADENRLLRLASTRTGNEARGALLEDLERVLLSIANAPTNFSADDLSDLQRRIDDEGLRFKVRITDDDLHREERSL
jgi:hypothetical protein